MFSAFISELSDLRLQPLVLFTQSNKVLAGALEDGEVSLRRTKIVAVGGKGAT